MISKARREERKKERKKERKVAVIPHKRAKANIECKMTAIIILISNKGYAPTYATYIYIRKSEIFLRLCADLCATMKIMF